MLLKYMAPSQALCNGIRLIVTKIQRNIIEPNVIDSDNSQTFFISWLYVIPLDNSMPSKYKSKQLLVRLAFRMTINKTQGKIFEKIYFMLSKLVFSHGQLYVALSRVRSFQSVIVVAPSRSIYNCIYYEVLDT